MTERLFGRHVIFRLIELKFAFEKRISQQGKKKPPSKTFGERLSQKPITSLGQVG